MYFVKFDRVYELSGSVEYITDVPSIRLTRPPLVS